jgi:serine/threonine protein kinase
VKTISRDLYTHWCLHYPPLEAELAKTLVHPNVVRVWEVIEEPDHLYLVQEHLGGGDLFQCMQESDVFSEVLARCCFADLLAGVAYLHSQGVVHRDLKPENCVLDEDGVLKTIDFGFAAHFVPGQLLDVFHGSREYAAPEIVHEVPYEGPPVDVWSCGVILYDMVMGDLPFDSGAAGENFKYSLDEDDTLSTEFVLVIGQMLRVDATERPSVDALQHSAWLMVPIRALPNAGLVLQTSSGLHLQLSEPCSIPAALLNAASVQHASAFVPDVDSPLHRRLVLEHQRAREREKG